MEYLKNLKLKQNGTRVVDEILPPRPGPKRGALALGIVIYYLFARQFVQVFALVDDYHPTRCGWVRVPPALPF